MSSLGAGGAERVISELANTWVNNSFDISFITYNETQADFYKLDDRINRIRIFYNANNTFGLFGKIIKNVNLIINLRTKLKSVRPNIIISFIDENNIITAISAINLKSKIIASERIDPFSYRINFWRSIIRPFVYKYLVDKVVVQTELIANKIKKKWKLDNLEIIPNQSRFSFSKCEIENLFVKRKPFILSVGRLNYQKGFDILIEAFYMISSEITNWSLIIIGEGKEFAILNHQIAELNMSSKITLLPNSDDISKWYSECGIFCLSSRFEGFPNVLLEAITCGAPSIAFDCPSGPKEILGADSKYGLLVDEIDALKLAKGLKKLILDSESRYIYSINGVQIAEKFSVNNINSMWLELFKD